MYVPETFLPFAQCIQLQHSLRRFVKMPLIPERKMQRVQGQFDRFVFLRKFSPSLQAKINRWTARSFCTEFFGAKFQQQRLQS